MSTFPPPPSPIFVLLRHLTLISQSVVSIRISQMFIPAILYATEQYKLDGVGTSHVLSTFQSLLFLCNPHLISHCPLILEWKAVTFIWHESMHDICLHRLSFLRRRQFWRRVWARNFRTDDKHGLLLTSPPGSLTTNKLTTKKPPTSSPPIKVSLLPNSNKKIN